MRPLLAALPAALVALAPLSLPAQQAAPDGSVAPGGAADELPASRLDAEPNGPYLLGEFTDWTVRCIRLEGAPTDPCEMHQTLFGPNGAATAEINIVPIAREGVAAGATLVTPLETLLSRDIRLTIDDGAPRTYRFTFCSEQSCVAQVGFTAEELDAMRGGQTAVMRIYPLAAPEQPVDLEISLSGFTAGFQAMQAAAAIE